MENKNGQQKRSWKIKDNSKRKGMPQSFKKGNIPWNKGSAKKLNDALSKWSKNGGVPWNKGLKGALNPLTGRKKPEGFGKKISDAAKKRVAAGTHNLWKGGVREKNSTERRIIMDSFEYKEWRRKVFARDNYTCQICGAHGVTIQADHIMSFGEYPELRFELSNGRTLCVPCHKKTDTYGSNIKKKEV